jgi:hypothetical protein
MPPKRKREPQGLARGEQLKRSGPVGADFTNWSWVMTEVTNASDITEEHCLAACGLGSLRVACSNKYSPKYSDKSGQTTSEAVGVHDTDSTGAMADVSDGNMHICDKKLCRKNPNCLNYLGQDKWESAGSFSSLFLSSSHGASI